MPLAPFVLGAALLLGAALPADAELERELARLESPAAGERLAAERWLASHAAEADYPLLAAAARGGGAEVRARLARALGARDASLVLAARFLREAEPALARLGEEALALMLARHGAGLGEPAKSGEALEDELVRLQGELPPEFLRLDLAASPERVADLLVRLGNAPVAVAVDPAAARAAARPPGVGAEEEAAFVGTWAGALRELARVRGLGLEGAGLEPGGARLVLLVRADEVGAVPPARRIAGWVRAVAEGGERAAAAARALAATEWPAALDWLAARGLDGGDAAARDAVLLAAGRGARVPALGRPQVVRALLELAAAALAGDEGASEERAALVLRALRAGPCVGAGAAPLAPLLLERLDGAAPREAELLLAALAGMGCRGADVVAAATRVLAAPAGTHPPALLRQALRTAVSAWPGSDPPPLARADAGVADPLGVLGGKVLGWEAEELAEVVGLLARSGAPPPAGAVLEDVLAATRTRPLQAVALALWQLETGEHEAAARALGVAADAAAAPTAGAAPLAPAELLASAVARGLGPEVETLLAAARDAGGAERAEEIDRMALLAGLASPERRAEIARRLPPGPRGYPLLGALAAEPEGETGSAARAQLARELALALEEDRPLPLALPLTAAVERALAGLLARRADDLALDLHREARGLVFAGGGELRRLLRLGGWPPLPPALAPRDLERVDRRMTP